jgi:hypothetical protein
MRRLFFIALLLASIGILSIDAVDASFPIPQSGAGALPGYTEDTREDGSTQLGMAWSSPRFTDQKNGTIRDNLTGLIWLRSANSFNHRTWDQALSDSATLHDGQAGLTDRSVAGDWRLPSLRELESLVCIRYFNPAISDMQGTGQCTEGNPFLAVQGYGYWSSTSNAHNPIHAWHVDLMNGYTGASDKIKTFRHVLPVRGKP